MALSMSATANLVSPELTLNPFDFFENLRAEQPIAWNDTHRGWLVTRHADVSQGYRDLRLSSNRLKPVRRRLKEDDRATVGKALETLEMWMVFQDEPDHKRLRGIVHKAFTPQAVAAMEADIEFIARKQIAALIEKLGQGEVDIVSDFAGAIPQYVICRMLGIAEEHQAEFVYLTEELSSIIGGVDDPNRNERAYHAMEKLEARLSQVIDAADRGQDNLITELVKAEQDGNRLSRAEVIASGILLLFGGRGTTASMIANSLRALLLHPDQYEQIKQNPALIANAVEEIFRWEGHTKLMPRIAREEFAWHDTTIKVGDRIYLCNLSANRDASLFDNPDRFDIARPNANRHIAFGTGIHLCLGQALARLQLRIVLREAVQALPRLKLVKPEGEWSRALLRRSQDRLVVTLDT